MDYLENQKEFTVSEISNALKRVVEGEFSHVRIKGEISGFKRAASGHLYFSLKDEKSVINAICWKGVSSKLKFNPEDGLEVVASGKITTYAGRSNYQISVDNMEVAGVGALMALLEKRKIQFEKEGMFLSEHKKDLPFLPKVIGVVTSLTGAVIRDILHRLEDRFGVHVLVWPVLVQGEGAAKQITNAIKGFNRIDESSTIPKPDLLIVARGGGSIEDLWAFNEEEVVRAAFESKIPLISAVGHETDTSLIDFVSDRRAPTPTAAAEMAVPVREELVGYVMDIRSRLYSAINRMIEEKRNFIEALGRGLTSPQKMIDNMTQRLDDWSERLQSSFPNIIKEKSQQLENRGNLRPEPILRTIEIRTQKIESLGSLLESYHYKKVLDRGFTLIRDDSGNVLTSSKQTQSGTAIEIEFSDGKKQAIIDGASINSGDGIKSTTVKKPETKKTCKKKTDSNAWKQKSLF